MRADRLLALLLLLQNRGQLTAQTLAAELGVSRRTILRDVEALSLAGVPIYASGGHGGGIALDEQYRTRLTGLHTPEVQALFVSQNQTVLQDVGLSAASQQLLLKLLGSLPAAHRATVDHIRQRLMIDPTWWWHDADTPPFWDELQAAVYTDRRIAVTYEHYDGTRVTRTLSPYSLVNKSSHWYLVAEREGELRTYRVVRIHALQLLAETFVRRPDFDLPTYWKSHLASFVDHYSDFQCTVRVHPDQIPFVKWLAPGRWEQLAEADAAGWIVLQLNFSEMRLAKMLLFGLGDKGELIGPQALRAALLADTHRFLNSLNQPDGTPAPTSPHA